MTLMHRFYCPLHDFLAKPSNDGSQRTENHVLQQKFYCNSRSANRLRLSCGVSVMTPRMRPETCALARGSAAAETLH